MNPDAQVAADLFSGLFWLVKVVYAIIILILMINISHALRDLRNRLAPDEPTPAKRKSTLESE